MKLIFVCLCLFYKTKYVLLRIIHNSLILVKRDMKTKHLKETYIFFCLRVKLFKSVTLSNIKYKVSPCGDRKG